MRSVRGFVSSPQPDLWKYPALLAEKVKTLPRADCAQPDAGNRRAHRRRARNLLVIGRAGVGLDNVDYKHAEQAGIVVSFTPDQNAISVAEIAIGMMLSLARFIPAADADTKKGNWNRQQLRGHWNSTAKPWASWARAKSAT